jgi:hypothetical protein
MAGGVLVYWRKVYVGREDERMGGGDDRRDGCRGGGGGEGWRGGKKGRERGSNDTV